MAFSSYVFFTLQFVCTLMICIFSQSLVKSDGNSWRGIIYEKVCELGLHAHAAAYTSYNSCHRPLSFLTGA